MIKSFSILSRQQCCLHLGSNTPVRWPKRAVLFAKPFRHMASASQQTSMAASRDIKPQNFDYFLVLDFEATCDNRKKMSPQEVIEFPVLKVSGQTLETEATYHQYIEPRVHKELTPFCTELTGIIQDMVDGQPHLEETLQSFDAWMQREGLLDPSVKSIFVTCGDWDLKVMLPSQTAYFGIDYPQYLKHWINIKKAYATVTQVYPKNDMMGMLRGLNIKHEGRHHSGIDDCKNIAKILTGLAERGLVFQQTGQL